MSGPSVPVRSAVFTTATTDAYGSMRVVVRHATASARAGMRVAVVHGTGGDKGAEPSEMIEDLLGAGIEVRPIDGLTYWPALPPFRRVLRAVAALDPGVLVSTQLRDALTTALLARRLDVPYVALVQNHPRFSGPAPSARLKWLAYRLALRSAERVVCVADHVAAVVEQELGVDPERIGVVQNLVEIGPAPATDLRARAEVRRSLDVGDDDFLIVNVGRFHRQKGQVDLLDALGIVADGRTVLAFVGDVEASGSGDCLGRLRKRVSELGLDDQVRWAGFRSDVPAVLDAADLFVSSSLWEAGPSLAVLEAMAAEGAVVATDHGDRVDGFVDEVHGLYVPVGDPPALAEAIKWMMRRSDEERRVMGRRARQLVEERQRRLESDDGFVEQLRLAVESARE